MTQLKGINNRPSGFGYIERRHNIPSYARFAKARKISGPYYDVRKLHRNKSLFNSSALVKLKTARSQYDRFSSAPTNFLPIRTAQ